MGCLNIEWHVSKSRHVSSLQGPQKTTPGASKRGSFVRKDGLTNGAVEKTAIGTCTVLDINTEICACGIGSFATGNVLRYTVGLVETKETFGTVGVPVAVTLAQPSTAPAHAIPAI